MPRVLIIGAKGMLGQDLMRVFGGINPVGWDREEIDITDSVQVTTKIKQLKPELIINAAAYNAVDEAENKAGFCAAISVNAVAAGYLAKAAHAIGAVFTHVSTDYVFDGLKPDGYREDDMPHPVSKYGHSKLFGERLALAHSERCYLIRTSRLFGKPGISPNAKKNFVDAIIALAAKQPEVKVIDEEISKPTYTPDLAVAVRELWERQYPFGIYHVVNEGACSWYEWAKEILAIRNAPVKLIPVPSTEFPRLAKRPKFSALLNTKFHPLRHHRETLKEYLKS